MSEIILNRIEAQILLIRMISATLSLDLLKWPDRRKCLRFSIFYQFFDNFSSYFFPEFQYVQYQCDVEGLLFLKVKKNSSTSHRYHFVFHLASPNLHCTLLIASISR